MEPTYVFVYIPSLLYSEKEIERVKQYTKRTFNTNLDGQLSEVCTRWIDKAIEQIKEGKNG